MLTSLVRTLLMYAAILLSVRLMGKRQISQLQTSEFVVTLLISELAVLPIQAHDEPLWNGLVPMAALVACEILVALLMLHSSGFRKLVCGRPTVVVERGRVLQWELRRLRMTTEELFEQLRQNGVFYLEEVSWAIIETNGAMSVIRRPEDDFLTPKQAGVKVPSNGLEVVVVSNGVLSKGSLDLCGKDEAWVRKRLEASGLALSQVFLMTARTDGSYLIVPKDSASPKGAKKTA